MKQHSITIFQFMLLLSLVIGILPIDARPSGPPEDFSPLFDGKTFKGWEGNKDYFRIEEGAVVAGNLKQKILKNQFLVTQKEYKDFELQFEARLIGQGNNAGVQFWSQRIPKHHEMIGFQCDIGGWSKGTIWGFLYDESRRRKMLAEAPQDELAKHTKPKGEWNKLRVHAKGDQIQIWLNDFQTVNYTEKEPATKIPRDGRFGIQIHSGPPAECWYRNIWLKEL